MTRFDRKFLSKQTGISRPARHPKAHAQRRRFLPGVDLMEDRTLLSILTVMNNHDSGSGSLRSMIAAAAPGDTINFAKSVHNIMLTSGELDVSTNLTIEGPGANELTVSGNNASRVFDVSNNATVAIGQLTIADGKTVGDNGGGILNEMGASLTLTNVVLFGNQSQADSTGVNGGNGGGIENDGSLTVNDSSFTKNVASLSSLGVGSNGGAIDSSGPALTVNNCTFTANAAVGIATGQGSGDGGAINNWASTVIVTNSRFYGNQALGRTDNGGAISNEGSGTNISLTISNSTFTGNQCIGSNGTNDITEPSGGEALGGAIDNVGSLTITASEFIDNLAKGGDQGDNSSDGFDGGGFVGLATGGGVCGVFGSNTTLSDVEFIGNQAIGGNSAEGAGGNAAGGGFLCGISSSATLTGVTFVANQAVGGSGGLNSAGGTGSGGGVYDGINSIATISQSVFLENQAVGGAGSPGAAGGDGEGGGIAIGGGFAGVVIGLIGSGPDTSNVTVDQSWLFSNLAQGGRGGAAADGGGGFGGGAYVDANTTFGVTRSLFAGNGANGGSGTGGGSNGLGQGGGVDVLGTFNYDASTGLKLNHASTSGNNIGP